MYTQQDGDDNQYTHQNDNDDSEAACNRARVVRNRLENEQV